MGQLGVCSIWYTRTGGDAFFFFLSTNEGKSIFCLSLTTGRVTKNIEPDS